MKKFIRFVFCAFGMAMLFTDCEAQNFSPYFILDQHSKYIDYMINSGKLRVEHPLNQPYASGMLLDSIMGLEDSITGHWRMLLQQDLEVFGNPEGKEGKNGKLLLGAEGGARMGKEDDKGFNTDFFGGIYAGYSYKNFGLFHNFNIDQAYGNDTSAFGTNGKLNNPNIGRSNAAYAQVDFKNMNVFVGRMRRNFGIMNEHGLMLSDNAHSFDHFAFTFANKALKFTTMFGRLDDLYGYDIRDTAEVYEWKKRYFSTHRFEIALLKNLEFVFSESVVYGGAEQGALLQYINPANFFYLSKLIDRKGYVEDEVNSLMSFEFYYKPWKSLTVYGSFLIDDIDFVKSLRDSFPDRLGWTGKIVYSDPFPGSQITLTYNRVSNWTYNSFYTWGNYTYFNSSLGYGKNGVENIKLGFDVFRVKPFILGMRVMAERERKQDLAAAFVGDKTEFPIGVSQNVVQAAADVTYFPWRYLQAGLSLEYVHSNNFNHVNGDSRDFVNVYFKLKGVGIFSIVSKKKREKTKQ
jgi:hypothetical protein